MADRGSGKTASAEVKHSATVLTHIHKSVYLNWFLVGTAMLIAGISLLPVVPGQPQRTESAPFHIAVLGLSLFALLGFVMQRRHLLGLWRQYQAGQQIERERASRHTSRVYALLNVSRMMVDQNELQNVFNYITKTCLEVFGADQASLMLLDADSNTLVVRAVSGPDVPTAMLGARQQIGKGVSGWVAQQRQPVLIRRGDRAKDHVGIEFNHPELSAAMVVPVILRGELVGVLNVSVRTSDVDFDQSDLQALEVFAQNVGAAIRHTEQAEWMRATIRKLQSQKDRVGMTGVFPARPVPTPADPEKPS